MDNKNISLDAVESGYWEELEKQVAEGDKDAAAGRVFTKAEALQHARNGVYEEILKNERVRDSSYGSLRIQPA